MKQKTLLHFLGQAGSPRSNRELQCNLRGEPNGAKVSAVPSGGLKGQAVSAADTHRVDEENSLVKV